MIHKIEEIASEYSRLSKLSKDKKKFDYDDFINFSEKNKNKYNLIETPNGLSVSTWYTNDLINDYRKTL